MSALKKKRTKPAKGGKARRRRRTAPGSGASKRPRRAPRIKKRRGPIQLLLPLQMPLALGVSAFAERPAPPGSSPPGALEDPAPPAAPLGEQRALWD